MEGNEAEKLSFGRAIQMASLPDDPYGTREGVLWVGEILKNCFPELFGKETSPDESKAGD